MRRRSGRREPARRSGTVVVAVGSTAANLLGYVFNAIMSRALDLAGFGELGSLLAVMVVASVPGTALQAVVARRLTVGDTDHAFRRDTLLLAGGVGVAVAALSPLVRTFLNVHSYAPVWWTAALLVPTTVGFGYLGLLQGGNRFRALGAMLIGIQSARVVGAVVAYVGGGGTSMALAVATVATVVLVIGAYCVVGRSVPDQAASAVTAPAVPAAAPTSSTRPTAGRSARRPVASLRSLTGRPSVLLRDIAADVSPILGVLVLSNLDLLLARHFLSAHDSGLYVAGNLLTRGAFWGPAFVVLVMYPRLAVPAERAAALRQGTVLLAVIGTAGLLVTVLAGGLIPVLLGRSDFRAISGIAWLYAADGLALIGAQFAVFAGLAVSDRRLGRLVWLAAVVETAVVAGFAHGSITAIVTVAVLTGSALVVAASVLERRRRPVLSEAGPDAPATAGRGRPSSASRR